MKRFLGFILCLLLCAQTVSASNTKDTEDNAKPTDGVELSAPSALLMEASTGQIIYEKEADEQRAPASVTKVMTLLLIFDAINEGKLKLEDPVTVSEHAASMGGSQVFLEPGESQTVNTMIKCITVSSANDACVAMAEHTWGSEEEFVNRMNQKAKELGMTNTNFVNCNGLDADGHVTTARDIALMSRALITTYPQIRDYALIWMENITHTTNKGTSEFGLSNTNKLVRQYQYTTGLKTGSTGKAKFCVSATAEKDGMELIAVIMAAPDSKARVKDATSLLNYGFGKCTKYQEKKMTALSPMEISQGVKKNVTIKQAQPFAYVDTTGSDLSKIEKKITFHKKVKAPLKKGAQVGKITYSLGGQDIGTVDIVTTETMKEITYLSALKNIVEKYLL